MPLIFSLVVIMFSAIIHEYMHGWTADRQGDPTARNLGRLTLNPVAHIDLWGSLLMPLLLYFASAGTFVFGYAKPVPFNPYNLRDKKYGEAKVALAGPMANLFTAIVFGMILRFLLGDINFLASNPFLVTALSLIVQINLVLMIFNLVPIPPLDGSKILMTFLPYNLRTRMMEMEKFGFFLVIIFIIFGFDLIIPAIQFLFNLIVGI